MKILKVLSFASLLLVSAYSFADDEAHKEAEVLFELMDMGTAMQQGIEQMLDAQAAHNPGLAVYKDVMLEFLNKHVSYDSIKPELIEIYATTFTASELREMNQFYRTPVGKKTLEKMPELMGKGSQITLQRFQENIHELQEMIEAERIRLSQGG